MDKWYERVRDLSLNELSVGDLCRACRQNLFLEQIMPVALERLASDVCAGELFDGELASAIARVSAGIWRKNPELAMKAKHVLITAIPSLDSDVVAEVDRFLGNIWNEQKL